MGLRILSVLAVVSLSSVSRAQLFSFDVLARIEVVSSSVASPVPPNTQYDVYHLVLENLEAPAISAVYSFPGNWINEGTATFRDATEIVFDVPDTFIVIPSGARELSTNVTDSDSLLEAAFTLAGTTPVLPLGESVAAVFSVPVGEIPDTSGFTASFGFIPEPSSSVIVVTAMASVALGRRR